MLKRHHLTAEIVDALKAPFEEQGLVIKAGTIVDVTIILAPSVSSLNSVAVFL
ncbi:MAG: hypothetical protein MUD17_09980 [Gemmatimonadaceae bacterium]|jgi:hypothetical protein|nr:hypothetical protein [Gemmatimonadaceae bacterium]